jgi:hypothetical protein
MALALRVTFGHPKQLSCCFVEPAVLLLLPDLPNKKGHLKVTFCIWRARQE